ncbi:PepSY domain-containing protein [Bacillus sp. 31A1R]|uniref:PepSY domain-containing protein n=1 Tax=Robertmurraya mangrovi TaxID=3098077 RepID=A0ABU5IZH3_9BACI|nr:PepSY domain-containing protein [Bacillus sp. 31A1R]MDZ5472565.1 PepSY domain-containing protein [Bacillus sp. 31A1R]
MNWKSFLLGLGIGIVSGYATKEIISAKSYVSSEKALASAKAAFKELGPISGSWIHMKTEPYEKEHLSFTVYKGGVSRNINGQMEQYEFVADARTGSIIDAYRI